MGLMRNKTGFKKRADVVRRVLRRNGLDGLLVTDTANVRYLTGFTGTAGLAVVALGEVYLIVDFRYFEQAAAEAPQARRVHVEGARYDAAVASALEDAGIRRLAFEADALTFADYLRLGDRLAVELVPSRGLVTDARGVKEADELACIRRAAAVTSAAVTAVLASLVPGQSEREIAHEIERQFRRLGAEGPAFPTLVAVGARSALPHPAPGDAALRPGDLLLVDAGARVDGYCADQSRTVVFGAPDAEQLAVFAAVTDALEAGIAAVAPGVTASAVDAAARRRLKGLVGAYAHPTGHGVGLEIHEGPRLAADADEVLAPGMVVTVEPGVYRPGWGGVRLEETLLVTADGAERLTRTPLSIAPFPLLFE